MPLLILERVFSICISNKQFLSSLWKSCLGKEKFLDACGFLKRFYLFIFRESGREGEKERNINVWLPLMHSQLGTWPATQTCALTGNWTSDPLVCRPVLNPLSYTSQGDDCVFKTLVFPYFSFGLFSLSSYELFTFPIVCKTDCELLRRF